MMYVIKDFTTMCVFVFVKMNFPSRKDAGWSFVSSELL